MIERLVRLPIPALRLRAARKAAERGMHWAALRGAADDPYVLARLGLAGLALRHRANDAKARFGALLARATHGEIDALADAGALDDGQRRLLAKAIAPHRPEAAAKLLPDRDTLAIEACRLAEQERHSRKGGNPVPTSELDSRLRGNDRNNVSEVDAIIAHHAIKYDKRYCARTSMNFLFESHGLADVIDDANNAPFTIDDLETGYFTERDGPLVTVIVPFHKNAGTIETALRSLTSQSWRNLEILAVDDRSTDGTADIVRRMVAADPRIQLIANTRTPGVYGARNTAIEAASGEYVTFLDADDWSPAERIARQVERLGDSAVCIANHIRMDESGAPVAPRVFPMVRPVPITMLLRLDTLRAAGPFDEVTTGADSEMLARLTMLHGRAAIRRDPAILLVARWRRGSLSDSAEGGMFGAEREAYRADWMFRHAGLEAPER